jgi:glycopeptide antibiotics resistance protein
MEITGYLIGSTIGCALGLMIGYLIITKLEKRSKREWKDWIKEHGVTEIG